MLFEVLPKIHPNPRVAILQQPQWFLTAAVLGCSMCLACTAETVAGCSLLLHPAKAEGFKHQPPAELNLHPSNQLHCPGLTK